jgi:hypothetical protein
MSNRDDDIWKSYIKIYTGYPQRREIKGIGEGIKSKGWNKALLWILIRSDPDP